MTQQKPIWQRIEFPNLPTPRVGSSLVLDSKNSSVLLFGGKNSSTGYLDDVWISNGLQWERRQSSIKPLARYGMSMAWDEVRQMAVLFGGMENGRLLGDTWLFDGAEWYQKQPLTSPKPRVQASLTYDSYRNLTILFGGLADNGSKYLESMNEMWIWDGEIWQQQFPVDLPPARFGTGTAYDKARQSILLFGGGSGGGILDDTWVWDGNSWKKQWPLTQPTARADFGMTYHEGKQQIILFGGQSYKGMVNDTWIWDGKNWAQLQTTQSPPTQMAYGAQLAYLPELQAVVLYNAFREKTIITDESFTITERSEIWILEY